MPAKDTLQVGNFGKLAAKSILYLSHKQNLVRDSKHRAMKQSTITALLLSVWSTRAFVVPHGLSPASARSAEGPLQLLDLSHSAVETLASSASILLSDEVGLIGDLTNAATSSAPAVSVPAAATDAAATVDTDSLLSGVRTFFAVLTALVFGLFGLTYFVAAFIVPKAAEQLEADTRRLRPGLWEEYEAKLEPGQTMATRPDILQELGDVMRPIIIEDFERSAAQEEANKKAGVVEAVVEDKKTISGPSSSSSNDGEGTSPSSILETDNQWKD